MVKSRGLILIAVIFTVSMSLFAQEIERVTFQEVNPNGRSSRDVTVNAIHMGWEQQRITIEGNLQITYRSWNILDQGWTEWEIVQRSPALTTNISEQYQAVLEVFYSYPRAGLRIFSDGIEIIRMWHPPNGKPFPIWWAEDGRSYYAFFKLYAIVPN